ncbi:peptidoglycan-binding domain-containing protein [Leptospira weilii]|uniref:peptidoglycan-binding domain-containing protein n=1 Tax=Leptospira weilii TaxID=28184 RepID=UPI00030E9EE3|nr:peptidoglycan-binding domain-containing protein [Leptospira weilii]
MAQRILRRGMAGADVKLAQGLLQKVLGMPVQADGIFGEQTVAATKTAQKKLGITIDGAIGPVTWSKLQSYNATPPSNPNAPTVNPTNALLITENETQINKNTILLGIVGALVAFLYYKNRKRK